jgi:hypothetical protein
MNKSMTSLVFGLLAVLGSTHAQAQNRSTPRLIKSFGAWGVYSYSSNGKTRCYTLSIPDRSRPANVDHGNNYFLISSYPAKKGLYPEAVMGYVVKASAPMSVSVDGNRFAMIAKGSTGWAQKLRDEPAVVAAMKAGHEMTVRAVSQRGTKTSYHYSLTGVTAALASVKTCRPSM